MSQRRYSLINKAVSGGSELNDLTSVVVWADVPDANITVGSVTQHEAALTITESQISDLGSYLTAVVASNVNAEASTDGWVLTSDGASNAVWEAVPPAGSEVNDLTAAVTWTNIPIANVPTGTTSATVSLGNHLHTGVYEAVDATIVRTGDAAWNNTDWDTAYGWGDHASGGYAASGHIHDGITDTNLLDKTAAETISGIYTHSASVLMADNTLDQPVIQDYAIESDIEVISANAATLTYSNGPSFTIDLAAATGDVTLTLSGGPPSGTYGEVIVRVTQDDTARIITWAGGTFLWPAGTEPTMSTGNNAVDIFHFSTWNSGTTWYGSAIQEMS